MYKKRAKLNKTAPATAAFNASIATSYVQDRLEPRPNTRMRAIEVWRDFVVWCEATGAARIGRIHFWAAMRDMGLYGVQAGNTWCFGVALKALPGGAEPAAVLPADPFADEPADER